jgi:glycosyltransferase involved in cell wall biosynthesis
VTSTPEPDHPLVTVIVPMLNEVHHIDQCLDGFAAQDYPLDRLEVLVVDGGSSDGSRQRVEGRARSQPWIRTADNPRRKAAAAFNVGVSAARGDVICLFSAHGVPDADYVTQSVNALRETGAAGVGGRYVHEGEDAGSRAIGLAMVSPFGMASPHRFSTQRREVDTISHPAYVRGPLVAVGAFDETLERNSDYELNFRLRADGGSLVFDPRIGSIYRPRPSLRALARQFWWYGRWKARVARRHPASLRVRHLVAPAAVAGLALAPVLAAGRRGRTVVLVAAGLYGLLDLAAVAAARPGRHDASLATLTAAFPVMHAAWGAGFWLSILEDAL